MLAEALVLGGDEGLLQPGGDGLNGDEDAAFIGQFGHQLAVGGVDARHLLWLVIGQPAVIGQGGLELVVEAIARHRADHGGAGAQHQQQPEDAKAAKPPAARRFGRGRRGWTLRRHGLRVQRGGGHGGTGLERRGLHGWPLALNVVASHSAKPGAAMSPPGGRERRARPRPGNPPPGRARRGGSAGPHRPGVRGSRPRPGRWAHRVP